MKKTIILLIVTLLTLQMQAQDNAILNSIQAKGAVITSIEASLRKVLQRKDTTIVQNGSLYYILPDKVSALFEDGNYMIINENRMKVDIGVFHGKHKLNHNKTIRSISRIFLYGIQGRCDDFINESGYTLQISQENDCHIIQFTTKKKHFLGLGYRIVTFKYSKKDLLIKEIVLIDYSDNIDTFSISQPKYGVTIDKKKFAL